MKKITLKELAKMLNLSVSTISRSLSDHPDISQETKRKVREASELYNYSPNLRARYLRTKSSGLIALILPEYNMFFIPELMNGVNTLVNEANYSLLVFQSDNSFEKELDIIDYCKQISVDGILLSVGHGFNIKNELLEIAADSPPIVLIDKIWENETFTTVGIDDVDISIRAVEYLYNSGHKCIGAIFGDTDLPITRRRMGGYEQGLKRNEKLFKGKSLLIQDMNKLENLLAAFLKKNKDITALYIMSDELMISAHYSLIKLGYKIPDDISIICISDGKLPYLLHPNITHFYHSGHKTGKAAAQALLDQIRRKNPEIQSVRVDCQLKQLGSIKIKSI